MTSNKILTDMAKSGKSGTDEYIKLKDERDSIVNESWEFDKPGSEIGLAEYNRLAGEIEARDSASRSRLSDEERAAKTPELRDDAIVIFDGERVAAFSLEHRGRDPQYAEQQAKFDALSSVDLTDKEMGDIPLFERMKEMKEFVFDTGWGNIILAPGGIENSLQHGAYLEKISVIPALPQLIQNGIYLAPLPQRNKQHGMIEHVFAAKVKLGTESECSTG